ncbi:hormogonium polysaccharide biosynthesis protein HpsA [Tolypothrix sp. VBCCA 56010]|uniref:hormogonium polysaccharide biosynthesis protein HpsA n=1 Tax=Tolypothrix sp. VBCCA 56010 TaxID=3137731 RepID=UPI003D7F1845
MSSKRQLVKAIKILSRRFNKFSKKYLTAINKLINWLLRTLFITKRRRESANAGFVLPTVAMVALVVVLLTTAILFRSFDRSKNASNVRVNEAVLNAAAPAIDRARAKLDALFEDQTLPRGTPSDSALYDAIKKDKYRLGDETRLKLFYDIPNSTPDIPLETDESLKTAWKFAVDTDNNGKKDTYTLYGIYFRSPTRDTTTGQFNRKRNPLEARTPPMDNANTNTNCPSAIGFSSLVGNSSWYKLQSGNLGKSFFVYTVNVPITKLAYDALADKTGFEPYAANKGFAALEFQQDRSRVPIAYNAVWSEHDLEITPGAALALNGRIHTNGNLLIGGGGSGSIELRQVSSKSSCFYNQENGQITVGGNVGTGSVAQSTDQKAAKVHLYQGFGNGPTTNVEINSTNKSTNSAGGADIGFNDDAYNQRIAKMKTDAITLCSSCNSATTGSELKSAVESSDYPDDIKKNVKERVQSSDDDSTARKILADEIELYLKNRTRRVPFAEVAFGGNALTNYTAITYSSFEPPAIWREPLETDNKLKNLASGTDIKVTPSQLEATEPTKRNQEGVQTKLGDRIFIGNNLPALWKLGDKYVGMDGQQLIFNNGTTAVNWTRPNNAPQRWRNTQIQSLGDLGISARNGFWEKNAAKIPENQLDNVGGVRIVTGAGIYVDGSGVNNPSGPYYGRQTNSFLTVPTAAQGFTPAPTDILVWPDTMPMSSPNPGETRKGDLLMRATAVYHYKNNAGDQQTPIACVSSYHDPSYKYLFSDANNNGVRDAGDVEYNSAKNKGTLPNVTELNDSSIQQGKSNNGVVYNFPGRSTFATYKAHLERQANLVFPNGRRVNQPLKDALEKIGTENTVPIGSTSNLELADYSAIDTALCAIYILNNEISFVGTPSNQPPHGAIKEASFLDAREIKQANLPVTATDPTGYLLDLELRQPSEVRVTDINVAQLITTTITGTVGGTSTEYLLPMSGIIYATREDALLDASNTTAQSQLLSPTDFQLDPTRRPNGIRLYNGETLARNNSNNFDPREKGLILATDLPAYIRGRFNLHRTDTTSSTQIEEFQTLESTSFYDRSDPQTKFACRPGRTGCPTDGGDYWRSATVIADSMTLLSSTFVDGARNQGDFDLNNNTGIPLTSNLNLTSLPSNLDNPRLNRLKNGFLENNYLTNTDWWQPVNGVGNTIFPKTALGSYTINGVTPIQRRANGFPLYVMEICRRETISECTADDWVVGFNINGDDTLSSAEKNIKANQLGKAIADAPGYSATVLSNWNTAFGTAPNNKSIRQRLGAGDTGGLALVTEDRRYPRRVAFARNGNNLVESSPGIYKPMGVGCPVDTTGSNSNGNGCNTTDATPANRYGVSGANISALWFRTTSTGGTPATNPTYRNDQSLFYLPPIDGSDGDTNPDLDGQPILVPVLQIHDADKKPNDALRQDSALQDEFRDRWLKEADNGTTRPNSTTIFNVTFVVGNSPSRPSEVSAGLQNLVRFLENWEDRTTRIRGGFIQLKRSSYATAPLSPLFKSRGVLGTDTTTTLGNVSVYDYPFDNYPIEDGDGLLPFFSAPTRNWGFDVGLLSEQPDLFAQRFTQPSTGRPSEFFREVGRDDLWVKTLLCAGEPPADKRTGIPPKNGTINYSNAVPSDYRPQDCPTSIPSDNG